jgi:transcription termination factor Rho
MTGGFTSRQAFLWAARNTAEGAALLSGTCLVDTGADGRSHLRRVQRTDMEVHLDRNLAQRRIYPAIDIELSGTRREELLMDEPTLQKVWLLRRMVGMISSDSNKSAEATERVLERLRKAKTNAEFLAKLSRSDDD